MTLSTRMRDLAGRLFGSPEHDRLVNFVADAWADLDRDLQSSDRTVITEPWARSAQALLLRAEAHIANREIEAGWAAALPAQRAILSNPNNPERVKRVAIALRREADKITGWRAKAIEDLIGRPKDAIAVNDLPSQMRVIDAVALRDDYSQNTWYKIHLRRRHLFSLFLLLWLALLACLAMSWFGQLPAFFGGVQKVSTVIVFGLLGATFSVARSLVAEDVSSRIPAQQIGSFLVWMRPGIGAAAALVVFALLHANKDFKLLGEYATSDAVIVALSFAAGYSERFVVGALDRLSQSSGKS